MHDLIIIGGGPAGLAAAIFALGKNLDARIIYTEPGGRTGSHQRLVGQVGDEHVAGENAIQLFEQQVVQSGAAISDRVIRVTRSDTRFEVETHDHGRLPAVAVLLATGARPVLLDVPGAQEFLGQGLGYSATTHAHILKGRTVAAIGQTERALRGVFELAHIARQVFWICDNLDDVESPLGAVIRQLPHVEVLEGYRVVEVAGGMNVEELVVEHGGETRRLPVDAAFADLGLVANSEVVQGLAQTDIDGFVKVDERRATSAPGLFAAGDVSTAIGEQKLIAVGEGARAAWSAYGYILAHRAASEGLRSRVAGDVPAE